MSLDANESGVLSIDEFCDGVWSIAVSNVPLEIQRTEKQVALRRELQEFESRSASLHEAMAEVLQFVKAHHTVSIGGGIAHTHDATVRLFELPAVASALSQSESARPEIDAAKSPQPPDVSRTCPSAAKLPSLSSFAGSRWTVQGLPELCGQADRDLACILSGVQQSVELTGSERLSNGGCRNPRKAHVVEAANCKRQIAELEAFAAAFEDMVSGHDRDTTMQPLGAEHSHTLHPAIEAAQSEQGRAVKSCQGT